MSNSIMDPRVPLIKLQRRLRFEMEQARWQGNAALADAILYELRECRAALVALAAARP